MSESVFSLGFRSVVPSVIFCMRVCYGRDINVCSHKLCPSHAYLLYLIICLLCESMGAVPKSRSWALTLVTTIIISFLVLYQCRYYVAEGVRLYSQESWQIITENKGVELVGKYIKNVVSF